MNPNLTVEEILDEVLRREVAMTKFYEALLSDIASVAKPLIARLHDEQKSRIQELLNLKTEISELRELTSSIAD